MEIGKQIKKYRSEMGVSQEELAERIFVSRQTVSNWENDKNYPDLKSVLLLSTLFGVSLDILIKGDIEQMKEEIKTEDIKYIQRSFRIHDILFYSLMLSNPLIVVLSLLGFGTEITFYIGMGIIILLSITLLFSMYRVSKIRKKFEIKSYKEIVAFYEGKPLSEVDKQLAREEPYPKSYKKRSYVITALFLVLTLGSVCLMFFVVLRNVFS